MWGAFIYVRYGNVWNVLLVLNLFPTYFYVVEGVAQLDRASVF